MTTNEQPKDTPSESRCPRTVYGFHPVDQSDPNFCLACHQTVTPEARP